MTPSLLLHHFKEKGPHYVNIDSCNIRKVALVQKVSIFFIGYEMKLQKSIMTISNCIILQQLSLCYIHFPFYLHKKLQNSKNSMLSNPKPHHFANITQIALYYMKQLFPDPKLPHCLQQKQELCLPHLRTKSMSIPNIKSHVSYASRYHDRKSRELVVSRGGDKGSVINLDEIEKIGKNQCSIKVAGHGERRKIQSQYETIDLWKEKHSYQQDYIVPRKMIIRPQNHQDPSNNLSLNRYASPIHNSKALEQAQPFPHKKQKSSTLQLKIRRQAERQKSIPDQFMIHRIKEISKLKNDDKLETVLKRENKEREKDKEKEKDKDEGSGGRKIYKSLLPVFEKVGPSPTTRPTVNKEEVSPTKWQTERQYTQQDNLDINNI